MKRSLAEFRAELEERALLGEVQRICRSRHVTVANIHDTTNREMSVTHTRREIYIMLHQLRWSSPQIAKVFGADPASVSRLLRIAPYKAWNNSDVYRRVLHVLETRCASYCLDNDEERKTVAALIAETLEK